VAIATLHMENLKEIDLDPRSKIKMTQPKYQNPTLKIQLRKHDNVGHIIKLFLKEEIRIIFKM